MAINYNFEILFEKLEEAKTDQDLFTIDFEQFHEVDEHIQYLRQYTEAVHEEEYQTFTRS